MSRRGLVHSIAALSVLVASSCSSPAKSGNVAISVAPLSLSDIGNACYDIQVQNVAGDTLWTKTVCADEYGDSIGDITYVGTCDAQASKNPNSVSVTLVDLFDRSNAAVAKTEYTNPCPPGAACKQAFTCKENTDVPVEFNLTVLANSDDGFVDLSVNLDVVSCSAKLDCPAGYELHEPQSGQASGAAVLALTCMAPVANDLRLYMTDLVVACDSGEVITISGAAAPGNMFSTTRPAPAGIAQGAVYLSSSSSTLDGAAIEQLSWVVAVAPDVAALAQSGATRCALQAKATASNGALPEGPNGGYQTPAGTTYPVISYDVPIVTSGANGPVFGCSPNPLNGAGSRVVAAYAVGNSVAFAHTASP
jgi:hypothetical protein